MKPSRPRPRFWPFAALPAAGLFALLAASAGMAGDRPPTPASRPAAAGRVNASQENKPMISYEVRWISGLDAEPWRNLLQDRLKLVSQDADVCAWIADDKAIFDLLTLAMAHTMTNVLQAPKAVGEENATVTLANVAKQFYVAQVEKIENQDTTGFRPTVKNIEIGVRLELTGALLDRSTKLTLNLHDTDLLAMHTLHRKDQIGDRLVKAEYQVPTPVERSCRVACEIPEGSSLLISMGMRERRGRSSDAAETASELLQLVGLPPLPARSVTCERLVCVMPRRVMPSTDRRASKKRTAPIKPESAHNLPLHVREPEVSPLEFKDQPRVIDPQQVEDRGVQVEDLDRVLDDVVREVVGLAQGHAGLDSGAGHPDGEAARVMVSPVVRRGELALRIDRAAEFAAPDDQRVIQKSALLQVDDQRRRRHVGVVALAADLVRQVAVLVPAHVVKLDEAHAALGQTAGQQAIRGIAAGLLDVGAVEVEDRLRLAREVGQLGHGGLHPVAELVLGDAGDDLRVAGLIVVQTVECGDLVEHLPAGRPASSRRGWRDKGQALCLRGASRPDNGSARSRFPRDGHTAAGRFARESKTMKAGRSWFSLPRP